MTWLLPYDHNELRLYGTLAHQDAGAANAQLLFYGGPVPLDTFAAPTGNLIGTQNLNKPSGIIVPGSGVLVLSLSGTCIAAFTDTITFVRIKSGAGNISGQGDVGLIGSSAAVRLSTMGATAGQPITVVYARLR